jgi:hypothetical protein
MIEEKFDTSTVYICEDTARTIVYKPTENNKMDIIDWLDKCNFTCAGVFTDTEDTARTFQYYFNCMATSDMASIKKIEESF